MRIPNSVHESRQWRVHEVVWDFRLEDVWSIPQICGSTEEFADVVKMITTFNPATAEDAPTRFLWASRDLLGAWLSLGRISAPAESSGNRRPIPGTDELTLTQRLPGDLRGTADDVIFRHIPFAPLYRTNREFAAEQTNFTVHTVMHLSWVDNGAGSSSAHMAVYVKPRGLFGTAYMEFIRPFRYSIVYPALERQFEHAWMTRRGLTD